MTGLTNQPFPIEYELYEETVLEYSSCDDDNEEREVRSEGGEDIIGGGNERREGEDEGRQYLEGGVAQHFFEQGGASAFEGERRREDEGEGGGEWERGDEGNDGDTGEENEEYEEEEVRGVKEIEGVAVESGDDEHEEGNGEAENDAGKGEGQREGAECFFERSDAPRNGEKKVGECTKGEEGNEGEGREEQCVEGRVRSEEEGEGDERGRIEEDEKTEGEIAERIDFRRGKRAREEGGEEEIGVSKPADKLGENKLATVPGTCHASTSLGVSPSAHLSSKGDRPLPVSVLTSPRASPTSRTANLFSELDNSTPSRIPEPPCSLQTDSPVRTPPSNKSNRTTGRSTLNRTPNRTPINPNCNSEAGSRYTHHTPNHVPPNRTPNRSPRSALTRTPESANRYLTPVTAPRIDSSGPPNSPINPAFNRRFNLIQRGPAALTSSLRANVKRVCAAGKPYGSLNSYDSSFSGDFERRNVLRRLMQREVGQKGNWAFKRTSSSDKFKNFRLQAEYDTFDAKSVFSHRLSFLRKRSRVVELVASRDMLFALSHNGACAVISRETGCRLCYLNVSSEEVIRSLFLNKNNDSLITVSVFSTDNFSSLKCRSTQLDYIRRGRPASGFALFEQESLKWPGFVEFDDVNGKVLTFSAEMGVYKIFDLKNYCLLYCLSDKSIQEIKISPGIMLLIFERKPNFIPLKILAIETGEVLRAFNHLLHRNRKIDFIEQFNEKLLVKQEHESLKILDVIAGSPPLEVSPTDFLTPSAFIFLYENQLFLTFRNRTVSVWNFRGEMVTSFEDHLLWYPDCNTNNIYITSEQDLIISYCRNHEEEERERSRERGGDKGSGSINISSILTGKLLAKITPGCCEDERENEKEVSEGDDCDRLGEGGRWQRGTEEGDREGKGERGGVADRITGYSPSLNAPRSFVEASSRADLPLHTGSSSGLMLPGSLLPGSVLPASTFAGSNLFGSGPRSENGSVLEVVGNRSGNRTARRNLLRDWLGSGGGTSAARARECAREREKERGKESGETLSLPEQEHARGGESVDHLLRPQRVGGWRGVGGGRRRERVVHKVTRSRYYRSHAKPNSTPEEALQDVTALFYDEERNEIFTGNRNGLVHVWTN